MNIHVVVLHNLIMHIFKEDHHWIELLLKLRYGGLIKSLSSMYLITRP